MRSGRLMLLSYVYLCILRIVLSVIVGADNIFVYTGEREKERGSISVLGLGPQMS